MSVCLSWSDARKMETAIRSYAVTAAGVLILGDGGSITVVTDVSEEHAASKPLITTYKANGGDTQQSTVKTLLLSV